MICWGSSWKQLTACLFQKHKASRQNLDFNIKLTTHIKVKGFIIFSKYKKLSDFFQWYSEAMVFWGYGILRLWYSEAVVFWGCFTDNKYCPLWIFDSYHNMEGQFCRFWKKQYWYLEIWHHPPPSNTHTHQNPRLPHQTIQCWTEANTGFAAGLWPTWNSWHLKMDTNHKLQVGETLNVKIFEKSILSFPVSFT